MLLGYARKSTKDQNYNLQIDALKKAGCKKIFIETASGAQRDRPVLKELLSYAREDDTIIIWKWDRLARTTYQLIQTVTMLEERKIDFRSLTEQTDTTTPMGRLLFHFFGALAEFERSQIRERTIEGLKSARARGKIGGRPKSLNYEQEKRALHLLKTSRKAVKKIAEEVQTSPSTLYRLMGCSRKEFIDKIL
jgi:DNA invertase Pin-like site-specific DNA recombinase